MKLPSERIREIATEKGIPNHEAVPAWIIASYLDEQAKENQPCEHKELDESKLRLGLKQCVNCQELVSH